MGKFAARIWKSVTKRWAALMAFTGTAVTYTARFSEEAALSSIEGAGWLGSVGSWLAANYSLLTLALSLLFTVFLAVVLIRKTWRFTRILFENRWAISFFFWILGFFVRHRLNQYGSAFDRFQQKAQVAAVSSTGEELRQAIEDEARHMVRAIGDDPDWFNKVFGLFTVKMFSAIESFESLSARQKRLIAKFAARYDEMRAVETKLQTSLDGFIDEESDDLAKSVSDVMERYTGIVSTMVTMMYSARKVQGLPT